MRIHVENSVGLIIDIQEKLLAVMQEPDAIVQRAGILIRGLDALQVPILATVQYKKGLGPTVPAVRGALGTVEETEKATFSCCDDSSFMKQLEQTGKGTVIIAGIETHVCVLQTALDLADRGFIPVLAVDATSSRKTLDKEVALRRMEQSGVILTTTESILFELTRVSGTPTFKAISKLIK